MAIDSWRFYGCVLVFCFLGFFFALAIALKMRYGYWQLKNLWLTFLAHGVGIKINGIFCYFPSFNHTFFFFLPTTYQSYLFHFIKCGWKKVTNLHFSLKSSAIMKGQVFDAFAWLKQNIPPWLRQEKRQSRPIVLQWLNTTKKKKKRITDFSFLMALDNRTCQDFQ